MKPDISPEHDQIPDEMANDVGQLMAALTQKYANQPRLLALTLTRNLGAFIAIMTKKPEVGLANAAQVLLATPHALIRAEHFGYTLGPSEVDKLVKPADIGDLIHIGVDPRSKRK